MRRAAPAQAYAGRVLARMGAAKHLLANIGNRPATARRRTVSRCMEPAVKPVSSPMVIGTIAPRAFFSSSAMRSPISGTGTIGIFRRSPSANHSCAVRCFNRGMNLAFDFLHALQPVDTHEQRRVVAQFQ